MIRLPGVTIYWFGFDIEIQRGYLCIHVSPYHSKSRWFKPWKWYCYTSLDATPHDCCWFFGRGNYRSAELENS